MTEWMECWKSEHTLCVWWGVSHVNMFAQTINIFLLIFNVNLLSIVNITHYEFIHKQFYQ